MLHSKTSGQEEGNERRGEGKIVELKRWEKKGEEKNEMRRDEKREKERRNRGGEGRREGEGR